MASGGEEYGRGGVSWEGGDARVLCFQASLLNTWGRVVTALCVLNSLVGMLATCHVKCECEREVEYSYKSEGR
jgi:hypothetical protein